MGLRICEFTELPYNQRLPAVLCYLRCFFCLYWVLSLPVPPRRVGEGQAWRGRFMSLQVCLLASHGGSQSIATTPLCGASALVTGFSCNGHQLLRPHCCFCLSYPTSPLLLPQLGLEWVLLWPLFLPFPLSHLPCLFQYAYVQMFQFMNLSDAFVCRADPLLNYSCPTFNFKERNKGVFSLCHDVYNWEVLITVLISLFVTSLFILMFLFESVLVVCVFLEICSFHLGYLNCQHAAVQSILL